MSLKFTSWPYWVRGGLIGILLYALSTSILIPFGNPAGCSFICIPYWSYPSLVILSPYIATGLSSPVDFGQNSLFIYATIIYFLLFGIFGWIYGKIKGRKKSMGNGSQKVD